MKNWKTTFAGVLAVLPMVAHQVWPEVITSEVAGAMTTILVAAGLVASKDHNVTGGSVEQKKV